MPSAELHWRSLSTLGLLMATMLAGCSSLGGAVAKAPADVAAKGATTAATASPSAEVAVTQSTQRAFDDARRLLAAGRTDEAERAFKALAQSNPELGGPHANLGLIYRQAGKTDEAVRELELAVKASPRQPTYLNQLGIAYRQQGAFDKARGVYERAIEIDPNYAGATLNLGILHDLYLGDAKRALELYERYLSLAAGTGAAADPVVGKWVADLKNRKPAQRVASREEKP